MIEDLASWPPMAPVLGGYAAFLGGVALYDARRRRIPNAAVYPALAVALGLAFLRPDGPWWSFLLAGLVAGALFLVLGIVSPGGMGMGDAKLAAVIGLMAGWPAVLAALFFSFATGALGGLALIAAGRIGRREPIPFGPALAVGALVAIIAGRPLAHLLWPGIA
ncbi:MAG TPA: A24 family peptidase [Candidatus Limnocylindrales bacterium]|nr:A24 family peptidase [Candidatus Limnocylindrales bacterium]